MASYLTFLQLCNLCKPYTVYTEYTVLERVEPFDLDEQEFRQHFRITKASAMILLTEVNCSSILYSPTRFISRICRTNATS